MKTGVLHANKPSRKMVRLLAGGFFLLLLAFLATRSANHSPTIDVLGSYFPAWMACLCSGLALTVAVRWIIRARQWQSYVGPAPLIYSCLMIIFTFSTWVVFYRN